MDVAVCAFAMCLCTAIALVHLQFFNTITSHSSIFLERLLPLPAYSHPSSRSYYYPFYFFISSVLLVDFATLHIYYICWIGTVCCCCWSSLILIFFVPLSLSRTVSVPVPLSSLSSGVVVLLEREEEIHHSTCQPFYSRCVYMTMHSFISFSCHKNLEHYFVRVWRDPFGQRSVVDYQAIIPFGTVLSRKLKLQYLFR